MPRLKFIQGNTFENIMVIIKNRNTGKPLDMLISYPLTSAMLYVYKQLDKTLVFSGSMDVTQRENGILTYSPAPTDFDTVNDDLRGEVVLTFTNGDIGKVDGLNLIVKTKAPTV